MQEEKKFVAMHTPCPSVNGFHCTNITRLIYIQSSSDSIVGDAQKTNLIESLLLGIPIPQIFVSQRADGVWDVIDGLQRLSTIYQFMGILKDHDGKNVKPLILMKAKYLPSMEGVMWNHLDNPERSLSQDLRLIIKRSKINASIILKESDDNTKYDLFQRLNTGGSNLSAQEVRNCMLMMLDKTFHTWLSELSKFGPFDECVFLSEHLIEEAYDLELVLRFVIFSLIDEKDLNKLGDIGIFVTDNMTKIAKDIDFNREEFGDLFRKTFQLLNDELGEDPFRRFDPVKKKFAGKFLLSLFEVVAFGVAWNLKRGIAVTDVRKKVEMLSSNREYMDFCGAGANAASRVKRMIKLGRKVFSV